MRKILLQNIEDQASPRKRERRDVAIQARYYDKRRGFVDTVAARDEEYDDQFGTESTGSKGYG